MGFFDKLFQNLKDKREKRNQRQQNRIDARMNRQNAKSDRHIAAYNNGIDPNKAWASTVGSLGNSASSALSNIFGFGYRMPNRGGAATVDGTLNRFNNQPQNTQNMMMIFFIAMMAFLFMGKRSKR